MRRGRGGRPKRLTLHVIVRQHTKSSAVDVTVLPALSEPREMQQTCKAESEGHRNQINQHVHALRPFVRNAFSVTSSEDPDIARAAISGVTAPAIAIGTATAL